MNIVVIPRFIRKDRTNGLNKKSGNLPDTDGKECKEMTWRMFKKKDVILIIHYSVCVTLIILSKFICKETKRYQNVLLKMSEKSLKVGAKTAFRRRFSSLFYRKTSFHTTRLHPFGRIATPFGVDGYTLWGKWCSLLSNTILHVTSRFLPWGNCKLLYQSSLQVLLENY